MDRRHAYQTLAGEVGVVGGSIYQVWGMGRDLTFSRCLLFKINEILGYMGFAGC